MANPGWLLRGMLGVITLSLCAGCGEPGPQRYDVSGIVMYQGQPLPAGSITFDPDVTKGNDGPQGYALIKDGKFDTRESNSGSVAGWQIVRIQGFDGRPGQELPLGKLLFADFSQSLDLPKEPTKLELEVPADVANK